MLRIPAASLEYLHVAVTADVALAALPVEIALTTSSGAPAEDDWHAAEWADGVARILVGPGEVELEPRTLYTAWVRVTSSPERPVLEAGPVAAY